MRKNVMLSLLAVTSASMTAYADANLTLVKNSATTDWQTATGNSLTLTSGAIVSVNGADVYQNITLYPGKYTLAVANTTGNVNITANGVSSKGAKTVTFEVKGTTSQSVEIRLSSTASPVASFSAGGFTLKLNYSFSTAASGLSFDLSEVINQINTAAVKGTNLSDQASAIGAKIKAIADDETSNTVAYDKYYVAYQLYKDYSAEKGYQQSTIESEITALKSDVANANNNTAAYNKAVAGISDMNTKLGEATTALANYPYTYKKDAFTATKAEIEKIITDFQTAAETANQNSTAVSVCTDAVIAAKKADVTAKVDALVKDIKSATTNTAAYNAVASTIADAKSLYSKTLQNLITLLPGNPDVYANMLAEAQVELKKDLVLISNAEAANGSADAHDGAAASQSTNTTNLATATTDITAIWNKYNTLATNLKADYQKASKDVTDLTASLDAVEKDGSDNNYSDATLTATYNTIKGQIDALKTKIDNANKDYTISTLYAGTDYANDKTAINTAITNFANAAAPKVANYNANLNCLAGIKALQKSLNANKKTIETKDIVTGYSAAAFWTATFNNLQTEINGYTTAANNAYTAGNSVTYSASNTFAATQTKIDDYLKNANAGYARYKEIAAEIAKYDSAYTALKTTASANTAVTVGGDPVSTDTYQSELDAYSTRIQTVKDALTAANAKLDDAHLKALKDLTLDATITSGLTALNTSYGKDKTKYDGLVQEAAATTMVSQATARVDAMIGSNNTSGTVGGLKAEYVNDYLGTATTTINNTLDSIISDIKAQRPIISTASGKVSTDAKSAIAILNEVNTALTALDKRINAMETAATTAHAAVVANNEAYTKAMAAYQPIADKLNGSTTVKGLLDSYGDPDKKTSFKTNTVTPLQTRLDFQKNAIENAKTDQNLVTAWADVKDAKTGKVTKGISTLLTEIGNDVTAAQTEAKNATANYNAKVKQLNAYNAAGFATLLTKATNTVSTKATDADVINYYKGLITTYITTNKSISDSITSKYNAGTSTSYTSVYTEISTLKDNINAIINGVVPNETAHNTQSVAIEAAQKNWTLVYDSISVRDQSYAAKEILASLAVQQTAITNLKAKIHSYYIIGLSKDKDTEVTNAIAAINTTVAQISADQLKNYAANILADNLSRYTNFTAANHNADSTYTAAINEIRKFNDIKNETLRASIQTVIDANKSIYEYSAKILNQKDSVDAEYNAALAAKGKVIFDIDEAHKADAVKFQSEIVADLKTFTDAVSAQAHTVFDTMLSDAKTKRDAAVTNISAYDSSVKTGAFADLTGLINKADLAEQSAEFAIQLDGFIDQFSATNIDSLVTAGYKAAADAEYNFLFDPIATQYENDLAKIKGYNYPNQSYSDQLTESYELNITTGNTSTTCAQKLAKNAGNNLYNNLTAVNAAIDKYKTDASSLLTSAQTYNQQNVDNKAAYDRMVVDIEKAQTALDSAKTYVSSFYYVAHEMDVDLNNAQNTLNGYTASASGYKTATTAVTNEKSIKTNCDNFIKNTVPTFISGANSKEIAGLTTAIDILKKEYNTAAAKYGSDNETIKGFDSDIKGYSSELAVISTKGDATSAAQSGLLALEGKVAAERTTIVNFYDASVVNAAINSISQTITNLKSAYETEKSYLATCDAPRVQNVYSAQLTAVSDAITAIEGKFNTYKAATPNTVLFYSDNLNADLATINKNLTSVTDSIKSVQDPIDANKAAFDRINTALDGYSGQLTTLVTKINAYASTANKTYTYTTTITNIKKLIKNAKSSNKTSYNNGYGSMNASTAVPSDSAIVSDIAALDVTAANNEAIYQIGILTTNVNSAYNVYGNSRYTPSDAAALNSAYSTINTAISNLSNYRGAALNGYIQKDINGKKLTPGQSIDFVKTAIPAINSKITEITGLIATYTTDVNNNSYILGDVKRDGTVLVNDYTELVRLAGDPTQVDKTSATFYAADINLDGKINVGDVTAVANLIKNGSSSPAKGMFIEPVGTSSDALSLSAEGEGSTQRIAINLTNTTAFVAGQMDIKLPAGMTLLGESLSGRANGHSIYSTDLSDGTHRVIISTVDNNEFGSSENAILYLDVNVTSSKASDKISVTNIMFTDASARIYNLADITSGEATGINAVESESVSSKIYSVGGKLMNAMKKGINIIRKADGSTQKVIKK